MADILIVRSNERLKAYSGQAFNLGAALIAAAAVRVSSGTVDGVLALWIVGAIGLISAGTHLLGYLEDDG